MPTLLCKYAMVKLASWNCSWLNMNPSCGRFDASCTCNTELTESLSWQLEIVVDLMCELCMWQIWGKLHTQYWVDRAIKKKLHLGMLLMIRLESVGSSHSSWLNSNWLITNHQQTILSMKSNFGVCSLFSIAADFAGQWWGVLQYENVDNVNQWTYFYTLL